MSHLGKRNIIFKSVKKGWDMLLPWKLGAFPTSSGSFAGAIAHVFLSTARVGPCGFLGLKMWWFEAHKYVGMASLSEKRNKNVT